MARRYQDLMHLGFNEVAAKAMSVAMPSTVAQIAELLEMPIEAVYRALRDEQAKEKGR